MAREPWIRTKEIRALERKLKQSLKDYLIEKYYDLGWKVAEIHRDLESYGSKLSYRMVHYYVERIGHDFRKGT